MNNDAILYGVFRVKASHYEVEGAIKAKALTRCQGLAVSGWQDRGVSSDD